MRPLKMRTDSYEAWLTLREELGERGAGVTLIELLRQSAALAYFIHDNVGEGDEWPIDLLFPSREAAEHFVQTSEVLLETTRALIVAVNAK